MKTSVRGVDVDYEIIGQGRPLLMLHGGGLDRRHMADELEPLFATHPRWKRIYLDLPGHGATAAQDWIQTQEQVLEIVLSFIDAVIPGQNFAVAGVSRGGYLARGVIFRRFEAVDGALLIAPASALAGASPDQPHVTLLQDGSVLSDLQPGEVEADHFQMLVVQTRQAVARLRKSYFPALALRDAQLRERIVRNYDLPFDVNDLPRPFQKPVLIVTGRQDDVTGYLDAWKMMNTFPHATFAVLDRSGHLVQLEQATLFNALADEWLQRVEGEIDVSA
jgi:pimeloyl-ACP methyl ester carboxylesterase